MKKYNNVVDDIITKGTGYAMFIGLVSIDGTKIPKLIFVSCDSDNGITYYDYRTTKQISPKVINNVVQFTQSTNEYTEHAIMVDLFYAHSEKTLNSIEKIEKEDTLLLRKKNI